MILDLLKFFSAFPSLNLLSERIKEDSTLAGYENLEKGITNLSIFSSIFSFIVISFFLPQWFAILIAALVGYYIYSYPSYIALTKVSSFRADSLLTLFYLSVRVTFTRNVEEAIEHSINVLNNRTTAILKQISHSMKTGKYPSLSKALSHISTIEPTFFNSVSQLANVVNEKSVGGLKDSVNRILQLSIDENRRSLREYVESFINPLRITFSLLILLPLMLLIMLPVVSIFLPKEIPYHLMFILFVIFIPATTYIYSRRLLLRRPPSLLNLFVSQSKKPKPYLQAFAVFALISSTFLIPTQDYLEDDLALLIKSVLIVIAIGAASYIYFKLSSSDLEHLLNKRDTVLREFRELIHKFYINFSAGIPFESTEKEVYKKGIFGGQFYTAMLELLKESGYQSTEGAAQVALHIEDYTTSLQKLDDETKEMFSEITSTLNLLGIFIVPLVGGIAIGLGTMMVKFLSLLSLNTSSLSLPNMIGLPLFSTSAGVIPAYMLQFLIGIYVIEMVVIVSYLEHTVKYGLGITNISSNIAIGLIVYVVVLSLTYPLLSFLPEMTAL